MTLKQSARMLLFLLFTLCILLLSARLSAAQQRDYLVAQSSPNADRNSGIDFEIQLNLLVASNTGGEGAKLPSSLEATVKKLRSELSLNNYRLAGTFISRVNNGDSSNTKGLAGVLLATTPPTSSTPSFYDLSLGRVRLMSGATGQELVQMNFHFGARLPVLVGGGGSSSGGGGVAYESTGISTALSVRENQPIVVGTMSLGASNEVLVLVLSAKKIE